MNIPLSVLHPELPFIVIVLSAFRLLVFSPKTQCLKVYKAIRILDLQKKKNKVLTLVTVGEMDQKSINSKIL